jgi:isopentenyl diphosphate isomerase/L-lactate dehydrogenase-like FMN-dependent dehydrogenase
MGQKIDMPLFCAPTALQRLFHHDGERAVAKAAEKFGTMFGISSRTFIEAKTEPKFWTSIAAHLGDPLSCLEIINGKHINGRRNRGRL